MNRIKYFLRLRKQNDKVKIICALILLGIFSLFLAISDLYHIYGILNKKVEYTLYAVSAEDDTALERLNSYKNVLCTSKMIQTNVSIVLQGETLDIPVHILSEQYMRDIYGIYDDYSMPVMYLSKIAVDRLKQNMVDVSREDILELKYNLGEEEGIAVIKEIPTGTIIDEEEMCVYMQADEYTLNQYSSYVLICMSKRNIDGQDIKEIKSAGYDICDSVKTVTDDYAFRISWLKAQYRLEIGLILWAVAYLEIKTLRNE